MMLPLDILIHILSYLPVMRSRRDVSASTLAACLRASSLLREAASIPSLWKLHYETRFEHSDEERERARADMFCNDWRLMYAARRQIDIAAMKCLDSLLQNRVELRRSVESIIDMSMDVWDVLELESLRPVPASLSRSVDNINVEDEEKITPHAITRRFWAKALLDVLSRSRAVSIWSRFWDQNASDPTFEETMNLLSCFFGYSDRRIVGKLNQLTVQCQDYLIKKGVVIDADTNGYDLLVLCREICFYMKSEGFLERNVLEDEVLSFFPHIYLFTHETTIQSSLLHVFVAIGTRLGLNIFLIVIDFPDIVRACVVPQGPNAQPIIVDPSANAIQNLAVRLSRHPTSSELLAGHYEHCIARFMLVCAGRNILSSGRYIQQFSAHPACLLALCVLSFFDARNEIFAELILIFKKRSFPLDFIFLLHCLQLPFLQGRANYNTLLLHCNRVLHEEAEASTRVRRRSVSLVKFKFFVGMPCLDSSGQIWFIFGWERVPLLDSTDYAPPLINDRIERETYYVVALDGTCRLIAFPEGTLRPASFTRDQVLSLFKRWPEAAVFFSGIQLPKDSEKGVHQPEGRGRLLLSPHMLCQYPEDDDVGSSWVKFGF